jgi:hypothetical protein
MLDPRQRDYLVRSAAALAAAEQAYEDAQRELAAIQGLLTANLARHKEASLAADKASETEAPDFAELRQAVEDIEREAADLRSRQAALAVERDKLKREAERAYRGAWHASGKAKIICNVCRKGPFDGLTLWRHGELLFCEEHAPAVEPTVEKKRNAKRKERTSPNLSPLTVRLS